MNNFLIFLMMFLAVLAAMLLSDLLRLIGRRRNSKMKSYERQERILEDIEGEIITLRCERDELKRKARSKRAKGAWGMNHNRHWLKKKKLDNWSQLKIILCSLRNSPMFALSERYTLCLLAVDNVKDRTPIDSKSEKAIVTTTAFFYARTL